MCFFSWPSILALPIPIPISLFLNRFPTSEEILQHATKGGVEHGGILPVHQVVSRGNRLALDRLLALLYSRLGRTRLSELVNTKVGQHQLGCLDMSLRGRVEFARPLRAYGATEQQSAPKDWQRGRRAHSAEWHGGDPHRGQRSREHRDPYWNRWPQAQQSSQSTASGSGSANDSSNWVNWNGGQQTWGGR